MKYLVPFSIFERRFHFEDPKETIKLKGSGSNVSSMAIPFDAFEFKTGTWSSEANPELKKSLEAKVVGDIANFLRENFKNQVVIKILAGESQVTNYDAEAKPPKRLEPGELARRRGETIKTLITEILKPYKSAKAFSKDPEILVEYVPGKEVYIKDKSNPKDPKYLKDQFIKLDIQIKGEKPNQYVIPPEACGKDFESDRGAYGNPEFDFCRETPIKVKLGEGSGTMIVFCNPAEVPDIFLFEIGGKRYSTGFLGTPSDYYRLAIGTILGNTYKGGKTRPWFLKDVEIEPVSVEEATDLLKWSIKGGYASEEDFKYAFPGREVNAKDRKMFKRNPDIVPYMLKEGQIKKWEPKWVKNPKGGGEIQESGGGSWYQKIPKGEGAGELKVNVCGMIGQTVWKFNFSCDSETKA